MSLLMGLVQPVYTSSVWNMYGQPDMSAEIKSKRLEWLGHVARMEENRMVKKSI
jgi:hypothetical protein